MKRFISAALAAALLAPGFFAVRARAQDDMPPPPPQDGGQPNGGQPGDAPHDGDGHEGGGHGGGSRLKKRLGLTDEQAAKLKDAMKAHGENSKPFGEQLRAGMRTLHEQLKSKASDEEIQKTIDSLKEARKGMREENEKFQDSVASFLTPTQQAKFLLGMVNEMQGRRGPGGPDGGDRDRRDRDHHDEDHDGD